MPSLSTIIQQTEQVLDDLLSIVNPENPYSSLLSETDRNRLVGQESRYDKIFNTVIVQY